MLKFIFWTLLCINGALLAYGQGYLGTFKGDEREPARMKNQLNADKLALVTAAKASVAATAAETQTAAPAIACIEFGSFSAAEARRFEAKVEPLDYPAGAWGPKVASEALISPGGRTWGG